MTSEQGNEMAAQTMSTETPPPYSPPPQLPWQQNPQNAQYVQQFMHQNPQGFVQQSQYPPGPMGGFSNIESGYGYNQQPTTQMSSQSTVIVNQPQTAPVIVVNQAPYSYIVPAILVCFFCCWPIGIGAIIAAAISQSQSGEMRYDEARKSASIAKVLTLVSLFCGITVYVILIVMMSVNNTSD